MATCPSCDRVVRRDLFDRRMREQREQLRARMDERERRYDDLAASRIVADEDEIPDPWASAPSDLLIDTLRSRAGRRGAYDTADDLRERLEHWDLSPEATLDELFAFAEELGMGVNLWTSAKRATATRYQCKLYHLVGWSNRHAITSEAPTAWAAVAAAIVGGFEQGHIGWE
jgi:hypothetical protein